MIKTKTFKSLIFIVIFAAMNIAINYLAIRHYTRIDMTKDKLFTLSDKSIAIISEITNPVQIYVYFKPEHELTSMLKKLLNSYATFSTNIQVHWIDPYHDFDIINSLGALKDSFKINSILLKSATKYKFLSSAKLAIYDRELEKYGIAPKLIHFIGEAAITGSLIDLSNTDTTFIALINNHGERSPNKQEDSAISSLIRNMSLEGYKFTFINLLNTDKIPDNINILVSTSPKIDFSDNELNLIYKWMNKGGSIFLAIDPLIHAKDKTMMDFNLPLLLNKIGIKLENNIVVDPSKQIPYSRPDNLYIDSYPKHEIVETMQHIPSVFFQSRSLSINKNNTFSSIPIINTTKNGWGETDYSNSNFAFNKENDIQGPVCIGIAAHNKKTNGKLIIFGDSDFVSNIQIKNPGNLKLIENCFYWLTDKTTLLNIPQKNLKDLRLNLNRNQLIKIFIFGVTAMPILILIYSLIIWIKRK